MKPPLTKMSADSSRGDSRISDGFFHEPHAAAVFRGLLARDESPRTQVVATRLADAMRTPSVRPSDLP